MKAQTQVTCGHCQSGNPQIKGADGINYHSVKESDGQGYSRFTYLCARQTAAALRKAKTRGERNIDTEIIKLTKRISTLLENREKVQVFANIYSINSLMRSLNLPEVSACRHPPKHACSSGRRPLNSAPCLP